MTANYCGWDWKQRGKNQTASQIGKSGSPASKKEETDRPEVQEALEKGDKFLLQHYSCFKFTFLHESTKYCTV